MTKKHRFRCLCRSMAFLVFIGGAMVVNIFAHEGQVVKTETTPQDGTISVTRVLEETTDPCGSLNKAKSTPMLVAYIVGVLYMFVAIALVCDEYFVPALEELASERFLDLSMDVAGATLMAAGGSAPELFTSFFGTFSYSDVGFGTIVGSAVFNVLFVIGMCAIFSKEVLTLTWWPLARDCTYYSFGLCVLAFFSGFSSPGKIELWEAVVQLLLYFGYVLLMKYNGDLQDWISKHFGSQKISDVSPSEDVEHNPTMANTSSGPSKFRAGLLRMFLGDAHSVEKAGMAMVTRMRGNAEAVFATLDVNSNGFIVPDELKNLFEQLDLPSDDQEVQKAFMELDTNGDGKVDLNEFQSWYIESETRVKSELRKTFVAYDADKSGTIDHDELKQMLAQLGDQPTDEELEQAFSETCMTGATNQITMQEFEDWYTQNSHWVQRQSQVRTVPEDMEDSPSDHLYPPTGEGAVACIKWVVLIPIMFVLWLTVPDVRRRGKSRLCPVAFCASIFWIGFFTYLMLWWGEVIGNTLGIPMVLMGLTVLAAGTSVPDLLSSVIVARMGEGDMAVSSSIGSNIFDITVGLPLPWLIFCLWGSTPNFVEIKTEGIEISILILLGMLVAIITMVHFSGWKMTKVLGAGMFVLYFVYLAQAIVRAIPFTICN